MVEQRMTSNEAVDIVERVLKALKKAGADDGRVRLDGGISRDVRFARNGITTNANIRSLKVVLYASVGTRTAQIEGNRLDDEGIAKQAAQAVANARVLPESGEYVPTPGPQDYDKVSAWFQNTAELTPEQLAAMAGKVISASRAKGVTSAGFVSAKDWLLAVGTMNGASAFHRDTSIKLTATARTADGTGSGWAGSYARDLNRFSADSVAEGAISRALRSVEPVELEPGDYPVILEPQAVANVIGTFRWVMNARRADEGRNFFSKEGGGNKIGERLWDNPLSMKTEPGNPLMLSGPFSWEAIPQTPVTWVDNGVLKELPYKEYWAQKNNRQPRPWPWAWMLEGDGPTTSLEEMIKGTERAILVTRLWYIRFVDWKNMIVTGLTRDGTFLVESGRITKPVKNFRFNESPVDVLQNVSHFSEPVTVDGGTAVPALAVKRFRFTSVSEAV